MVILRDMREADIEDYVRWFTRDTNWMQTDAPWEENDDTTPEAERRRWRAYYESVKDLAADEVRWKFEIEVQGRHVGWVSSYTDLEYLPNPQEIPAVGIDIPAVGFRRHGVGTEALRQFIAYLKSKGYPCVYTQTWSGNAAMLRVAEKLGFTLVCRMRDHRTVGGRPYDALTLKLDL